MKKEMLINVLQPEECRIAILEDGVLEELYVERTSHESYVGNIYKGRIVNIEPSIQAAFVDFGVGRNGFLHVSDVEQSYYRHKEAAPEEGGGGHRRSSPHRRRNDMTDIVIPKRASPEAKPTDGEEERKPLPTDELKAGDAPLMPSAERRTDEEETAAKTKESPDDLESAVASADESRSAPPDEMDEPTFHSDSDEAVDGDDLEVMDVRDEMEEEDDEPRRPRRGQGSRRGPMRRGGRPGMGRPKPPIQEIFRRGQEVLVQVIKEGIGTKGPTLSTYISIPGRYLVLMPGLNRIGVSRKIADDEHRRRLREILSELQPPKGLGFIIRTAGLDRNKKELQRDLAYLARLWKVVVSRVKSMRAPASIYQESDMITRTIRDIFTSEIDTIWVDEQAAFDHAKEFLTFVMPRYASRIQHYNESEPLFHRNKIEDEIARIQRRHVPLPHGGSIVIDQTEALVAIDVNSGNFRADNNAEETAYRMNLQAAKEIARQLRLRDLGGVIVNDFIDMRDDHHRREVERAMRDAVKRDRARTKILKISQFGIIEMTRQRIRPSLKRSVFHDCPHCNGTGQVKTSESMSIEVMRMLQLAAHRDRVARVQVKVTDAVAQYLLNKKRKDIAQLEESGSMQVTVVGVPSAAPELLELFCTDSSNSEIKLEWVPAVATSPRARTKD